MRPAGGRATLWAMTLADPITATLAVTVAALLMLLSAIGKKQIGWRRPGPPRRRGPHVRLRRH